MNIHQIGNLNIRVVRWRFAIYTISVFEKDINRSEVKRNHIGEFIDNHNDVPKLFMLHCTGTIFCILNSMNMYLWS